MLILFNYHNYHLLQPAQGTEAPQQWSRRPKVVSEAQGGFGGSRWFRGHLSQRSCRWPLCESRTRHKHFGLRRRLSEQPPRPPPAPCMPSPVRELQCHKPHPASGPLHTLLPCLECSSSSILQSRLLLRQLLTEAPVSPSPGAYMWLFSIVTQITLCRFRLACLFIAPSPERLGGVGQDLTGC